MGVTNYLARRTPRAGTPEFGPKRSVVVCLEREPRTTADGIEILPWNHFLDLLWDDSLLTQ